MSDYLDDEVQIANERDLIHDGALQHLIRDLPGSASSYNRISAMIRSGQ